MDHLVKSIAAAAHKCNEAQGRPTNAQKPSAAEKRHTPRSSTPSQDKSNNNLLTIDGIDQVRSEMASVAVSPLIAPTQSPAVAVSAYAVEPSDAFQSEPLSVSEVELYHACEALCIHISGVDYRRVAHEASRALALVTSMLHEELSLAARCEWVPSYLVARQADRLRNLFAETKQLLVTQGVPVPPAILRLCSTPQRTTGPSPSKPSGSVRPRSVSLDVGEEGTSDDGKGPRNSTTAGLAPTSDGNGNLSALNVSEAVSTAMVTPLTFGASSSKPLLVPSADEAYDVRVMHSAFDDTQEDAHVRELEDEILVLKHRIEKLSKDKKELTSTVERQEAQLAALRSKLTKETEAIYMTQRQMQADLRQLAVQTGHRELLGSDDDSNSPSESTRVPPNIVGHALDSKREETQQREVPQPEPTPPVSAPLHPSGTQRGNSASIRRHFNAALQDVADGDGLASTVTATHAKFQRLETIYAEAYRGKPMDFVWAAIDVAFKSDYDVSEGDGSEVPTSLATQDGTAVPSEDTSTPVRSRRQEQLHNAFKRLQEDFGKRLKPRLENFDEFASSAQEPASLRSDYIAQCMQHRVRPNSGIVDYLSKIANDGDVEVLDLSGNYIGDGGVVPLLSVVNRLYRLRVLRLADNGVKNNGVKAICTGLRNHAVLTELDLSKNYLTRSAGKDLLTLIASTPKLSKIVLEGTHLDEAMIEKIEKRLRVNIEGGSQPLPQQMW